MNTPWRYVAALVIACALLAGGCAKEKPKPPAKVVAEPEPQQSAEQPKPSLAQARKGFQTRLTKQEKESFPAETPPARMFELIKYESPAGELSAYVSRVPWRCSRHQEL